MHLTSPGLKQQNDGATSDKVSPTDTSKETVTWIPHGEGTCLRFHGSFLSENKVILFSFLDCLYSRANGGKGKMRSRDSICVRCLLLCKLGDWSGVSLDPTGE